jgi:predicted nucleic acid-binding protein
VPTVPPPDPLHWPHYSRRRRDAINARVASTARSKEVDATGHCAEIVAKRRRAGTPISGLDAQIAAICRQYEASLATRNVRDFAEAGIGILDPWAR